MSNVLRKELKQRKIGFNRKMAFLELEKSCVKAKLPYTLSIELYSEFDDYVIIQSLLGKCILFY